MSLTLRFTRFTGSATRPPAPYPPPVLRLLPVELPLAGRSSRWLRVLAPLGGRLLLGVSLSRQGFSHGRLALLAVLGRTASAKPARAETFSASTPRNFFAARVPSVISRPTLSTSITSTPSIRTVTAGPSSASSSASLSLSPPPTAAPGPPRTVRRSTITSTEPPAACTGLSAPPPNRLLLSLPLPLPLPAAEVGRCCSLSALAKHGTRKLCDCTV